MATRARQKLSAKFVLNVKQPGTYGDGGHGSHGLTLRVRPATGGGVTKSWVQRLRINGRAVNIGLGPTWVVSLGEAREIALDNHRTARRGGDPRQSSTGVPTFTEGLEAVIAIKAEGWRDADRTAGTWRAQTAKHAATLGPKPVDEITPADVLDVLTPIWHSRPEMARKQRQRIGAVMKWAIAQGHRDDNPAGDAIAGALPKQNGKAQHHRALPFAEVAGAISKVRESGAWAGTKLAFEFLALTATRSGEVRNATWAEIDMEGETWEIPGERTKTGDPQRVPLSPRALEVLAEAAELADGSGLVFPSPTGRPQSDSTMSKLLRELGIEAVPHGLRTSFRSWAAETTDYPSEVAEMCLGHAVGGKVERAYQRSDLYSKRAELMAAWAAYLQQ